MHQSRLIVGGEFVVSPTVAFALKHGQFSTYGTKAKHYNQYYTFGAYYSIKVIIDSLRIQPNEFVLLPSYLCPSIIEPFAQAGVKYDFYKMNEGLLPDLEDIERKAVNGLKAVLFIDFFGIPQRDYLANLVTGLRSKGIVVIQDTVQSWLNNEPYLYGDFCFNSLRKFSPFEASVLFSKNSLSFSSKTKAIRGFLSHKRYAQLLRFVHVNYGFFKPSAFLGHIDKANRSYHQEGIIGLPKLNKWLLDRIDFASMGRKRRLVYTSMNSQLSLHNVLKLDIGENVPLGLPVYLEDRDKKKGLFHSMDIHCPVHWLLSDEIDKQEHEYSWELSRHELTLPVNVKLNQLPEYIHKLQEVL